MYREISPAKLIEKRGSRSRKEIEMASGRQITEQDLYGYELGKWKPSPKKLPHLLQALGATYDEVSEPVELVAA